MKKSRISILSIASCLAITTGIPAFGIAATAEKPTAAEEISVNSATNSEERSDAKTDLTAITKKVKQKISIPSNLTEFDYNMHTDEFGNNIWNLYWSNKENNIRLRVQCNEKGSILGLNYSDDEKEQYKPVYKKEELKKKADAFLKQVDSELFDHVTCVDSFFEDVYNGRYIFVYERTENEIPMPDNQIRIGVNSETAEVTSYLKTWNDTVTLPGKKAALTKEDAIKKIEKQIEMKLWYRTKYSEKGESTNQAYLVYLPTKDYISIDALSGEVYTTQAEGEDLKTYKEESAMDTGENSGGGLTQSEINKIDKINNIISKKEAIQVVKNNKQLYFDENMTKIDASLYEQEGAGKSSYVWRIQFSDPRDIDYAEERIYRGSANAVVDAKTGKLVSYYASIKDGNYYRTDANNSLKKYSEKECNTIFEKFAQGVVPNYMKESTKGEVNDDMVIGYKKDTPIYSGYSYLYNRVYKDIPYEDNYILGSVDAVTGKVYSFSYNWNPSVTFENPSNVISKKQAFDSYISKDGFALIYELNTIYNKNGEIKTQQPRLVYNTSIYPNSISPFTGEQLNYDGTVFEDITNPYTYKDIKGIKAEEDILLLADMQVGFKGEYFEPEKAITGAELAQLLRQLRIYDTEIEKNLENKKTITRSETAKVLIQLLNLEKAANLTDIYNAPYIDKDIVNKNDIGYLTLAQAFGMLSMDSENKIHPNEQLTRADTASALVALLKIK